MIFENVRYSDFDIANDIYCECFAKERKEQYLHNAENLFGLYMDDKLIGIVQIDFIPLAFENKRIAYINSFCIKKEFQHKGYSSILLQKCITYIKDNKATVIQLTSNPSRIVANKLYRSFAFNKIDTNFYQMII